MKRALLIILFLALISITSCVLFPKSPVYYKSPAVSAKVIDAFTGKPIEDATVQVRWSALRPKIFEGSDQMDIHTATVLTDSNGFFTIPAWGSVPVAREWHYYEFDPMVSFSKSGYKPAYKDNHNNQDSVTSGAIPFFPVTLELPSWADSDLELERLNTNVPFSTAIHQPNEMLSNVLGYYVVRGEAVEDGRFIDTVDFPKIGYIRPQPEVIIKHIKSFSINVPKDYVDIWHIIEVPENQHIKSGISITLFQEDAKKVADLERKNIAQRDLLFMLGDKPLAETYMAKDAGYSDSIPAPTGPQTIYLPLRDHQNIQEINDSLKKLVETK